MRDSNPRYPERGIPDFESSAFGHSANLPLSLVECKSNTFSCNGKILWRFFNYINVYPMFMRGTHFENYLPRKNFLPRQANVFCSPRSNFSLPHEESAERRSVDFVGEICIYFSFRKVAFPSFIASARIGLPRWLPWLLNRLPRCLGDTLGRLRRRRRTRLVCWWWLCQALP